MRICPTCSALTQSWCPGLFPCVPIYIKLANQAAAKSEEQSKEYATSKDKNKKMRLLVSAVMLLAEMFDMGSDWYVFFNQVRPNQARIEEAISEYFTIAYTVALVVTTVCYAAPSLAQTRAAAAAVCLWLHK